MVVIRPSHSSWCHWGTSSQHPYCYLFMIFPTILLSTHNSAVSLWWMTVAARSSSHGHRGVTLCWPLSPLSPSPTRWSLRSPPPPLLLSTSWRPSPTATSRLPASRSWSARARWRWTRRTRRWRPSRSAWGRASRGPASTWRASCGKRRRTVSRLLRRQHHRQLQKECFHLMLRGRPKFLSGMGSYMRFLKLSLSGAAKKKNKTKFVGSFSDYVSCFIDVTRTDS